MIGAAAVKGILINTVAQTNPITSSVSSILTWDEWTSIPWLNSSCLANDLVQLQTACLPVYEFIAIKRGFLSKLKCSGEAKITLVHFISFMICCKSIMERIRFDLHKTIYRVTDSFNTNFAQTTIFVSLISMSNTKYPSWDEMNGQHFVYIWANHKALAQTKADWLPESKFVA